MEIEIFNKDAREVFLEPGSVDLFLTHPPYFYGHGRIYGGDPSMQIHNTHSLEKFLKSMLTCIKNMETALSDTGNILLILPPDRTAFQIITEIEKSTNLIFHRCLFWSFEKSSFVTQITGMEINLILHISKNKDFQYPIEGLNSFIIDQVWVHDEDVHQYKDISWVKDSFPQKLSDFLIPLFSKEGDTVADPFGGTGTVAISTLKINRKAIYNDASLAQVEIAKKRIDAIINREKEQNVLTQENLAEKLKENDPGLEDHRVKTVELMTRTVERTTRAMVHEQNPDSDKALAELEKWQSGQRVNLDRVNNEVYSVLREAGLFK